VVIPIRAGIPRSRYSHGAAMAEFLLTAEVAVLADPEAIAAVASMSGFEVLPSTQSEQSVEMTIVMTEPDTLRFVATLIDPHDEWEIAVMGRFGDALGALLFCAHLAMPGRLVFGRRLDRQSPMATRLGVTLHRRTPVAISSNGTDWPVPLEFGRLPEGSGLDQAARMARELGWPTIRELSPTKVLQWIKAVDGWDAGIGRGRVGRALAAFSAVTALQQADTLSPEKLVWALSGLEALYCEGRAAQAAQLLTKSEVLLGPRLANKPRFARMYDYRSRFVHGDQDLPFVFREPDDGIVPGLSASDQLRESENIAVAMLVASLQELVDRDWHGIEFLITAARA